MNNSFALMAPHNLPQTTIVLPNPKISDDVASSNEVLVKQFLDGSLGTYVRRTGRRTFSFSFELTQEKDEELRRFIAAYVAEQWRMFHWDQTVWVVHLVRPEYDSTTVALGESKETSLILEGTRLS